MLKMMGQNVLIKQDELKKEQESGIILPESTELKADPKGTVIAVGSLVQTLTSNDRVWFGTYAGTFITHEGTEYLILHERDILAILK